MDVLESKQWHERLASELKIYQRNELRNSEIALKSPPRVRSAPVPMQSG